MKPEEENQDNEIYNNKEKEIIEEDIRLEQIQNRLNEIGIREEKLKEVEAKLKKLEELSKEMEEIEIEAPKINKAQIRKRRFLGTGLIGLGVLILLWGTVWFFGLEIGWACFVSIFIVISTWSYGGTNEV